MVLELTSENFDSCVLKSPLPVLVDFWAPWCAPCLKMAPMLEDLAKQTEGSAVIGKVNVAEYGDVAERFLVRSVPMIFIVKNGKIIYREAGARDTDEMKELLQL